MPSTATITAFNEFSPNKTAKSSEVNTNFSVFRGHLLPVNTDTASASDLTHDLGAEDHRFNKAYVGSIDLETSTTTASLLIEGSLTDTTGAFNFVIDGSTVASIDANGFNLVSSNNLGFARSTGVAAKSTTPALSAWTTLESLSITSLNGGMIDCAWIPAYGPSTVNEFRHSLDASERQIISRFRIYRDTTTNLVMERRFAGFARDTITGFPGSFPINNLLGQDYSAAAGGHTYFLEGVIDSGSNTSIYWEYYSLVLKETPYTG